MKLTAAAVSEIFFDCLFRDGEPTEPRIEVEGIMSKFGFHPGRIEAHKAEIMDLLLELPDNFRPLEAGGGGGWSFLCACNTRDAVHWGEHPNMEQLFALGLASGQALNLTPQRSMWEILPGGMPYYRIVMPVEAPADGKEGQEP